MDLGLKKTLPVPLVLLVTFLPILSSLHFITKLTISWYLEPLKPWTLDLKSTLISMKNAWLEEKPY